MISTINRFLLEGAHQHERDGAFVEWTADRFESVPDWRADRTSIRIALVLQERFGVEPGDAVALSMRLGLRWLLVERAVWGLGAMTVPVDPAAPGFEPGPVVMFVDGAPLAGSAPAGCRGVLDLGADYEELLDYGGVLDTPERATRFRARARETPPEALASIDSGRELTQADWLIDIGRFHDRHPPVTGRTHVIVADTPSRAARIAAYAGWGGGIVRSALMPSAKAGAGTHPDGFVTLSLEGISDHG